MGAGDELIDTLTRPIGAAKRLLDAAKASTDPAYLKRKFTPKPKTPPPRPYEPPVRK